MTADEDPRSSPNDDTAGDDSSSARPSTPSLDPNTGEPPASSDGRTGRSTGDAADESSGSQNPHGSGDAVEPMTREGDGGPSRAPNPVPGREGDESFLHQVWYAEGGPLFFLRELLTSVIAVLFVGLLLFGISGVWPPMVAVESGSMEPHMHRGDLVFITEPGRYSADAAYGTTGVVTAETGAETGYRTFGGDGSVVVYDDPGQGGSPIIHRTWFYVEEGENWYDRADPEYVSVDSCSALRNCPAPHAGFITKGDANGRYDQASGIAEPVKPEWITGIARIRVPYLGWVRLGLADVVRTELYGALSDDAEFTAEQPSTGDVELPPIRTAVGVERGHDANATWTGRTDPTRVGPPPV